MRRLFPFPVAGVGHTLILVLPLTLVLTPRAAAQQQRPDHNLPLPRLTALVPPGAQAGTTVEVTIVGTDLEDPTAMLFSFPGIKAEPIAPPPPPPDAKNPPPSTVTKFKVTVPPDAPLGTHDVRIVNKWGVSNPRAFMVGDLAEVMEKEPNNDVGEAQRVEINTTVNGVIAAPTDVDYFLFAGKQGQRVVISCLASSIDSRLLAALELYDTRGKLLGYNRHYQDGDALLDCTLPADGEYLIRLFEFTHLAGSPEHFYRLTITTGPWIDAIIPPMIEPGKSAQVTVYGRNLPGGQLDPSSTADGRTLEKLTVTVEAPAVPPGTHPLTFSGRVPPPTAALDGFEYRLKNAVGTSNPFLLTFARAPVVLDNGNNETPETAQEVPLPCEIAGTIEKKRDRDWYSFTAKKAEVFNIEVLSDRIGAPADMKFLLRNPAANQTIVEQDDNPDVLSVKFFIRTHDPAVYRFTAPADGKYQLLVTSQTADTLAGPRQFYRVRITPDLPDFQLFVMPPDFHRPDGGTLLQGSSEGYTIFALRQDGWNGEIALTLDGLPTGVTCPPQALAPGQRQTELILTAAADAPEWTGEIHLKGTATINGQAVVREARPATITWPVPPQQNIPTISRLDRNLMLAVRGGAPFNLTASLDKPILQQGDKATLNVKLTRIWPDFKTPMQLIPLDVPPNLNFNNNQQATIAPDKSDAALPVAINANVPPGTYNLVLRGQAQIPYNKDPKAMQKPNVNVVLPCAAVAVTVLPKSVGTVAVTVPNPNVKAGEQVEVTVKITRLFDFAGEFKVELVLPQNVQGVSADPVTLPAGQNEAKLVLKAAADAAPGPRADLIVRASATLNGNVPTTQEAKFTVTVVK
jgi:hypothetical protein